LIVYKYICGGRELGDGQERRRRRRRRRRRTSLLNIMSC
jgi:hypothetical protein